MTNRRVGMGGRVWALVFVLLTVLPFTAPFQTIDLTAHPHQSQRGEVVAEKTPTKDVATTSPLVRPVLTVASAMTEAADAPSRPTNRQPLTTALRL